MDDRQQDRMGRAKPRTAQNAEALTAAAPTAEERSVRYPEQALCLLWQPRKTATVKCWARGRGSS